MKTCDTCKRARDAMANIMDGNLSASAQMSAAALWAGLYGAHLLKNAHGHANPDRGEHSPREGE